MKVVMTESEMVSVFGNLPDSANFRAPVHINGEVFNVWWYHEGPRCGYRHPDEREVTIELIRKIVKTPQEVIAEDAVRKAEASLQAAKETLNKIKEKV